MSLPTPRDVRDVVAEASNQLERIRIWSEALRMRPPALPPLARDTDQTFPEKIGALRAYLAEVIPTRLSSAQAELSKGETEFVRHRRMVEQKIKDIVNLAYQLYSQSLFNHAARAVGPHRAEDVMQQVWLAFIMNVPNFNGQSSVQTYLRTILDNLLMRMGVDYARRARDLPVGQDDGAVNLPAPTRDPLFDAETQQERERMGRALLRVANLSQKKFQRLVLYYLIGLEARRIATIEGIEPGGVQAGLFHARAALAKALEEEGGAR